jgi:hypothetical protein
VQKQLRRVRGARGASGLGLRMRRAQSESKHAPRGGSSDADALKPRVAAAPSDRAPPTVSACSPSAAALPQCPGATLQELLASASARLASCRAIADAGSAVQQQRQQNATASDRRGLVCAAAPFRTKMEGG